MIDRERNSPKVLDHGEIFERGGTAAPYWGHRYAAAPPLTRWCCNRASQPYDDYERPNDG